MGRWAFPAGQVSKLMQEPGEHGVQAYKEKAAEVFRALGNQGLDSEGKRSSVKSSWQT